MHGSPQAEGPAGEKKSRELLKAEDQLKRTFHFLQSLIDNIPAPIFYKGVNGIYLGCNIAFERYLGLTKDQIVGKTVYGVSPPELAEVYHHADEELFKKRAVQQYESRVRYADGSIHDVIFYKAPFYNPDGTLGGLIGIIFDITDRKKAERELKESHDLLERRVRERTAELMRINRSLQKEIEERKKAEDALRQEKAQSDLYVDLMGHDINNLNQIAMGYVEMAQATLERQGNLDDNVRTMLEKPIEALRSTAKLIDSVKKLQREKAGGYSPMTIDLGTMLKEVISEYRSVPGRDITINYVSTVQCEARANVLLKDVFANIVGNAIKHSSGPLTVTVRLERAHGPEGDMCKISIEDNGPGIPDPLKKKLFDTLCLYRARAGGKGFGLCLIKMLLDDYHGKFWVEDRIPGDHAQGARFVVMLPTAGIAR